MAKLRQVGNSLVVTIPAALAKQYGLGVGDEVEIEPDGDALRLVPMLRVPKHRAGLEADHESEARELLRRYHSEISEALERAEQRRHLDGDGGASVGGIRAGGVYPPLDSR